MQNKKKKRNKKYKKKFTHYFKNKRCDLCKNPAIIFRFQNGKNQMLCIDHAYNNLKIFNGINLDTWMCHQNLKMEKAL